MTAVEWLVEQLFKINNNATDSKKIDIESIIEQAKEIEKEQQGYSEEEVEQIAKFGFNAGRRVELKAVDLDFTFEKWFKQFKKQIK
jgi:hypothetical protein